jgi:uncharacterized protein (UPF0254 family)
MGFTFDMAKGSVFGEILYTWEPADHVSVNRNLFLDILTKIKHFLKSFQDPHDITVSQNGHKIYTGELDGEIDEFRLK